jgi:ABC-type dipeptide/oligopeptide/nickel transport system ATPase component
MQNTLTDFSRWTYHKLRRTLIESQISATSYELSETRRAVSLSLTGIRLSEFLRFAQMVKPLLSLGHLDIRVTVQTPLDQSLIEQESSPPQPVIDSETLTRTGCAGCPFAGKITSPIQLGERETAVAPVAPVNEGLVSGELPDLETPLPRNYQLVPQGVFVLEQASEDEPPKKVPVLYTGAWVSRVFVGELNGQSEVEFSWYDSYGEIKTDIVANKKLGTDRGVAEFFRGNNIIAANMKLAMRYIDACIMVVTRSQKEAVVYSKYGLHKRGFVVGSDIITPDGKIAPTRISSQVPQKRRDALCVSGSRDAWIDGTALLDKPEYWPHRYMILAALASPIFALAEDQGSVLSIVGESGGGKTVAANYGLSAYGHPSAMTIEPKSTDLGFYHIWDSLANLPVVCNEASEIANKQSIIYAAANGTSRTTSSQEGVERTKSGWKLLTIFTSNHALLSLPATVLNTATRYRILELVIEPENMINLDIGGQLHDISDRNYGHIGRELLQAIMPVRGEIAKEVGRISAEYIKTVDDDMRFGIWQVAAASVVGRIAQNLGLIKFEIDDCIENAIATLTTRTSEKIDPATRVMEFLNNYTNTYQESIGRRAAKSGNWMEEPRGEARGKWRIADDLKEVDLSIAITPFTAAALAEGIDTNYIKRWIKQYGVSTKAERLARSANPVKCYTIPAERVHNDE